MKTNLKTFPKMVADPCTNEKEVLAWKTEFEKELREKLEHWKPNDWVSVNNPHLSIKEILGE